MIIALVLGSMGVDTSVAVVIKEKWAGVAHRADPFLHLQSLLDLPQGIRSNLCTVLNTLKK